MSYSLGLTRFSGVGPVFSATPRPRLDNASQNGVLQDAGADSLHFSGTPKKAKKMGAILGTGLFLAAAGGASFVVAPKVFAPEKGAHQSAEANPTQSSTMPVLKLEVTDNHGNVLGTLKPNGDVVDPKGKKLGRVSTKAVEDSDMKSGVKSGKSVDLGKVFIAYDSQGKKIAWGGEGGVITAHYPAEEGKKDQGSKRSIKCLGIWHCEKKPDKPIEIKATNSSNGFLNYTGTHEDILLMTKQKTKEPLPPVSQQNTKDFGNVVNGDNFNEGLQAAVAAVVANAHGKLVFSRLPSDYTAVK